MSNDEQKQLETMIARAVEEGTSPLRAQIGNLEALGDANSKAIKRIDRFVTGDEMTGEGGAKIRLDRLEQSDKTRKLWTNTALVAAIAAVIGGIANLIIKH